MQECDSFQNAHSQLSACLVSRIVYDKQRQVFHFQVLSADRDDALLETFYYVTKIF